MKLMAGGGDPDYARHLETNLFPKCTLDPADLDLAALKALDKIRKSPVIKAYSDVYAYIDAVVSAADLKVPEILVQAKAWELAKEYMDDVQGAFDELPIGKKTRDELAKKPRHSAVIWEKARAELATPPAKDRRAGGPPKALRQSSGQEKGEENETGNA